MAAWFDTLGDDLKYGEGAGAMSVKDHPWVKESPDLNHFVMKSLNTNREVGARIPLPRNDERDANGQFKKKEDVVSQWRKDHLEKLYTAGVLDRPPADPKDYKITKPESIPPRLSWSDDLGTKFSTVLHKYGVPTAAVQELMDLHVEGLLGTMKRLDTDAQSAENDLRREFGDKYDSLREDAKRLLKVLFQKPEELEYIELTGIGDHPHFLGPIMRLAPLTKQDSSFMNDVGRGGAGGTPTGDQVKSELADIMSNPNNPRYKLFKSGDPEAMRYVDDLYRKAYPGTITI